jgi:restriction system protein
MKLKMAEKSLFAILLRSPWWVSIGLAAVFGLGSKALLPAQYVIFGAMGGFPFVVIGIIAAWRQLQAPSPAKVAHALEGAASMSWRDFSDALERGFKNQGHAVTRPKSGVADFKLDKAGRTTLVSAKRWKAANQGVEPLRELVAARDAQDAQHCTCISLGPLTDNAVKFAKANQVQLIYGTDLAKLIS